MDWLRWNRRKTKVLGSSVVGPGHINENMVNQDALGIFDMNKGWLIVTCDGMGSCIHADKGATYVFGLFMKPLRYLF